MADRAFDLVVAFMSLQDMDDVGGVMVNEVPTMRVDNMPYGGTRDSGIGREGPRYAMHEMSEPRLVLFNLDH